MHNNNVTIVAASLSTSKYLLKCFTFFLSLFPLTILIISTISNTLYRKEN